MKQSATHLTAVPALRFELNTDHRTAQLNGEVISVGARAFDLLVALYARRERMVTKDELLDLVWPSQVVEESNIQVQVSALRKAFGRDALATIPGRGYQWTLRGSGDAAVTSVAAAAMPMTALAQLPEQRQPLLGRELEIGELSALLRTARWVTILGAGGIGKTSLARAVIAQHHRSQIASDRDPVCWVDLTTIDRADQLVAAIGKAAATTLPDDQNAEAALFAALRDQRLVLVLDNCEHVAERVAQWTAQLLEHAALVRVLATSQEPFRSAAVHTYRLQALGVPAINASAEQIRLTNSVTLLLRRARAENHRFEISDADLPLAANLCRELEGLPLAIEMAAARLPVLGIRGLNERLSDRLKLFRLSYPNLPPRQQSLRGALEWTYSLLDEKAQQLLLFLSEFVGGFRLDAAQSVAEKIGIDEFDTLDVLSVLVDKSLVRLDSTEPLRYRILETARLFSQEQLIASDLKLQSADAHAEAMTRVAVLLELAIGSQPEPVWSTIFQSDYDNMDAALAHGSVSKNANVIAHCAECLFTLEECGSFTSPRANERVRAAFDASHWPNVDPRTRARLLNSVAPSVFLSNPVIARHAAARLRLDAWRGLNDLEQLAAALAEYAMDSAGAGELESARAALDEIDAINQSGFSVRRRLAIARLVVSALAYLGDTARLVKQLKRNLETAQLAGSVHRVAVSHMQLGDAMFTLNNMASAIEYGQWAVTEFAALGQMRRLRYAYANLCAALCFDGQIDRASAMAIASLDAAVVGHTINVQADSLSLVAASRGDFDVAARMLGVGDAWCQSTGMAREPSEVRIEARTTALLATHCNASELAALRSEGAAMNAADVVAMIQRSVSQHLVATSDDANRSIGPFDSPIESK